MEDTHSNKLLFQAVRKFSYVATIKKCSESSYRWQSYEGLGNTTAREDCWLFHWKPFFPWPVDFFSLGCQEMKQKTICEMSSLTCSSLQAIYPKSSSTRQLMGVRNNMLDCFGQKLANWRHLMEIEPCFHLLFQMMSVLFSSPCFNADSQHDFLMLRKIHCPGTQVQLWWVLYQSCTGPWAPGQM